jgi:conjugative transfer region protein TrbK
MATDQTRRSLVTLAILFAAVCVLSVVAGGPRVDKDVATLARNPQALQQVLHDCRMRMAPADDPACRAASEAWRRRFFGNANSHPSQPDAARPVRSQHPQGSQLTPSPAQLESHSTASLTRLIGP